jgi:XTP/dITP diphosphohydrolase
MGDSTDHTMTTARLLLATNNPGKIIELQALLAVVNIILRTPTDLGIDLHVNEDGSNYAENATRKALAFAEASGFITLADDSGLEVDALDGAPGLHSARYAPIPNATDADRRRYLLKMLKGERRPWTARFRATIAITDPKGHTHTAEGQCRGEITPEARGAYGFGYDPIFLLPELGKTMAELSMAEKNRLSHRARAVKNILPLLLETFNL